MIEFSTELTTGTVTTQTIADKLNGFQLTYFDASNFYNFDAVDNSELHGIMLASESLLAQDWSTPEEDEAWADL